MTYSVQQIGVTGPRDRIGGSSPYHIDTKFSSTLSMEDIRDRFDVLATQYQKDGRKIEFSNQGVGGEIYSLDMSPEDRLSLLTRASGARAHRPGWHSFDYYAPNIDAKDRWDSSAEGAPIYVVGAGGLKVEGASGGNYGNYGLVIGADGNVISKSGHGDDSQAVFSGGTLGNSDVPTTASPTNSTPTTPQQEAVERTQNYSKMSKAELDAAYDGMRNDPVKAREEGMKMHKAFFGK